jgi:hypothetical protein
VNAAILVLTSALLTGADPEKVPGPSGSGSNAPVASSCGGCGGCGYSGGCGGCCDSGCDEGFLGRIRARFRHNDCGCCDESPSLLERIRARFHRDDCCQPSCCQPTCCQPTCCQPTCHTCNSCAPTCHTCGPVCSSCSSCSSCECGRESLRDRIRGWFHRGDCCDSGCNSCGSCGGCGGAYYGGSGSRPEAVPLPKSSGSGTGSDILQTLPKGDSIPTTPPGIIKETPY